MEPGDNVITFGTKFLKDFGDNTYLHAKITVLAHLAFEIDREENRPIPSFPLIGCSSSPGKIGCSSSPGKIG